MSMLPDKDHPLSASCLCGDVAVTLLDGPRSMLHCACRDCQRTTGAGHLPIIMMRARDIRIDGETHTHAITADSGAVTTRHFCPRCGSHILGISSRAPDVVSVPAGLFAGQSDWFAARSVIFARSLNHWDMIDPAIPRHDTYRR